ncbi:MAG: putative membrane protein [Sphingobacteriales bacterium]|jgi:putative membrane protein
MNYLFKILISGVAVMFAAYVLPGVAIDGFVTALWVAVILSLLNGFVKPLLIILTIPVTVFTLGLFLVVINAAMILLTDYFISDFVVDNFWWALLFSIILSIVASILERIFIGPKKPKTSTQSQPKDDHFDNFTEVN